MLASDDHAPEAPPDGSVSFGSTATGIAVVRTYEERVAGEPRATWSGGVADDGRWLLHGPETWSYPAGGTQWEATYEMGRKVGKETFWREDGSILWTWDHRADGTGVWTRFWPNGRKRSESTWRDLRAEGVATEWSPSGEVVRRVTFRDGVPVD
jgi:hypothetical protein